jgi:hypothetical protein
MRTNRWPIMPSTQVHRGKLARQVHRMGRTAHVCPVCGRPTLNSRPCSTTCAANQVRP